MEILVTGGAGMIGSNLVRRLVLKGHRVRIVDNLWRGTRDNLVAAVGEEYVRAHFRHLDLEMAEDLSDIFSGVETVFHLADIVGGINYVFGNEYSVWKSNLAINSKTLDAAIKFGVKKIVYVGTACSYPEHLTEKGAPFAKLVESDAYPANPESSYGWSKLMGEYEIELAEKANLIDAVILRLHNVYGFPTELVSDRAQVIPSLVRKAIRYPEEDFIVWGSGSQRRSFVWVGDVVDALEKSLTLKSSGGPIQISPDSSTSIGELAEIIVGLSGKKIRPKFDTSKPEGDHNRVGDYTRAKELLNWSPKTSLNEGLGEVMNWADCYLLGNP